MDSLQTLSWEARYKILEDAYLRLQTEKDALEAELKRRADSSAGSGMEGMMSHMDRHKDD